MKKSDIVKIIKEEVTSALKEVEVAPESSINEDTKNFKKGDIVIPNMGPHKGIKHRIIFVSDSLSHLGITTYTIQPILALGMRNKYHLGAATAQPEDLTLSK